MEKVNLKATDRSEKLGKIGAKTLRGIGVTPGVLYQEGNSIPIQISSKDLTNVIKQHGQSAILELSYEGKEQQVFIKEIQRDPINHDPLHFDLQPISMYETMVVHVPIHIEGANIVEGKGGIVQRQMHEIEVEALPNDIPKFIEVDISNLNIGDHIQVDEIQVGENIKIIAEPNDTILTITEPRRQEESEEEAEETQQE